MLGSLWRRDTTAEQRAMQVLPFGDWGHQATSASGVNVNNDSALNLLTVYGCVSLISDTIATLPRDIFRKDAAGQPQPVNVPRWIDQPNADNDAIEFITQSLVSLLLDGNCYWAYRIDSTQGIPAEIIVLNPADVTIQTAPAQPGQLPPRVYLVKGQPYFGRLLHIKGAMRPGMNRGISPVESARQSIGIGLASAEFAARFYANGTTVSGVIQTPGEMTPEQATILKQKWGREHGGLHHAHEPGVLTNGATWNAISVTPEQAQFLATRQFQAAEICAQMFHIDPSFLGLTAQGPGGSITYANLEQRGIHLVQFTLLKWIIRLERAYTFLLPKPQYMKFNVEGLQRADLKTRYESYRIGTGGAPWMTENEVRDLEDLPPLPHPLATTAPLPPPKTPV